MTQIDRTLEMVLTGLQEESTALSESERFAGEANARPTWMLIALDRQVATFADLPNPDISKIGELRLVIDGNSFYEIVEDDQIKKWVIVSADSGILFEYEKLHGHFSRQESETLYQKEFEEGLVSRMGWAKLQSDFISGCERDFRSRHRTAIRSRLHVAAMSKVAGMNNGTLAGIRGFLGRLGAEIEEVAVATDGAPEEYAKPGLVTVEDTKADAALKEA